MNRIGNLPARISSPKNGKEKRRDGEWNWKFQFELLINHNQIPIRECAGWQGLSCHLLLPARSGSFSNLPYSLTHPTFLSHSPNHSLSLTFPQTGFLGLRGRTNFSCWYRRLVPKTKISFHLHPGKLMAVDMMSSQAHPSWKGETEN